MMRRPGFLRPTLVRRVILALLLAFGLVWLVQLAAIFWQITDRGEIDRRLQTRAAVLLDTLAPLQDDDDARRFMQATARLLNTSLNPRPALLKPGNPRQQQAPVMLQLARNGKLIFASAQAAGLSGETGQGADLMLEGRPYRIWRQARGPWQLAVAEPRPDAAWLLARISADMSWYLALSFPLMLVPLWIAVSSGLRPLRQLSGHLARKGSEDLQPLGLQVRYAELHPLAEALDQLLSRLRLKIQRETAFVHDAAHELRTPLAVISAQAHLLAKAGSGQERSEARHRLEQATARASHLIGQLLELAEIDGDRREQGGPFDLAHLVRQELALLIPAATARGVEIALEAPDCLPCAGGANALRTILQNLLTNALRYVPRGGRILVTLAQEADSICLEVLDDGPGIAEHERELVFERFYRAAGQDTPGSGLGLAIVKQAAGKLGGSVHLAAGPDGRGCLFSVRFAHA